MKEITTTEEQHKIINIAANQLIHEVQKVHDMAIEGIAIVMLEDRKYQVTTFSMKKDEEAKEGLFPEGPIDQKHLEPSSKKEVKNGK